jgi:uncharacterized protein (DUF1697 family)
VFAVQYRLTVTTRVLLVRAVNVGGVSLPMGAFRAMLTELGGRGARTYIASGNAVVDVPGDPDAFDRSVEAGLRERFGIDREVISRTPEQLRAALDAHPFEIVDPKYSYVTFLRGEPDTATAASVPTGPDRWAVVGGELHLRFAEGMGRATLNLERLLRSLGVVGTARNLRTVERLIAMADGA